MFGIQLGGGGNECPDRTIIIYKKSVLRDSPTNDVLKKIGPSGEREPQG